MFFKNHIIVAFVFISLMFQTTVFAGGYKYNGSAAKCSITFPGEFKESKNAEEAMTTYKVLSQINDDTYLFSYSVHNQVLDPKTDFAEVSLDGFVGALKGTVLSKTAITKFGFKGYEAEIKMPDLSSKIIYQVIIAKQIQYQIVFLSEDTEYDSKVVGKYFKSFKIKN